ncbi:hypothetical protein BJX65DRAFT_276018 [Aspergillus insuetus]
MSCSRMLLRKKQLIILSCLTHIGCESHLDAYEVIGATQMSTYPFLTAITPVPDNVRDGSLPLLTAAGQVLHVTGLEFEVHVKSIRIKE